MKTATLLDTDLPTDTAGVWQHYRLDPPMTYCDCYECSLGGGCEVAEYVIVSAANVPYSGPETYIFSADENGNVTNWSELPGSYRGDLDHENALHRAGYAIAD